MGENNDRIVYVGRLNGCVVYVGEGKPGRETHLNSGISHVYEANQAHFSGARISVEIVHKGLSKTQAIEKEKELIISLQPTWNKTLTRRSELVRKFNSALVGVENLLHVSNKLALIYACKDVVSGEGVALIKAKDVNSVGGNMRKIYTLYKNKKKPEKVYDIKQVSKGLYEVHFKSEWLKHLDYNISHLVKIAEKRYEP